MQATESGQCLKVYHVCVGYINVLSPIQRIGSRIVKNKEDSNVATGM